jgi:exodeoxyribonuclease-3
VADLSPDLAVIQECEQPERIPWKQGRPPTAMAWFGESPTKGIGVFSWTNLIFQPVEAYDRSIRYCIPIQVTSPYQFHLIAVWAMDHPDDLHSYSGQVYLAIGAYREFILSADTVFIGDYNSSKRTTPKSRMGNHAALTLDLKDLWLISAYHHFYLERQGQEKQGTFFRGRKIDQSAHLDYAYIPTRWLRRLIKVWVGEPAIWLQQSDHCPVIVEIHEKDKSNIV